MDAITLGDAMSLLGTAVATGMIIMQVRMLDKKVAGLEAKIDGHDQTTRKHGERIIRLETISETAQ